VVAGVSRVQPWIDSAEQHPEPGSDHVRNGPGGCLEEIGSRWPVHGRIQFEDEVEVGTAGGKNPSSPS
jgi:hypothetical protein